MRPPLLAYRALVLWASIAPSAALSMVGCGGGSAGPPPGWTLTLSEFSTDDPSVAAGPFNSPTGFKFQWAVEYTQGLPLYAFYVHMVSADGRDGGSVGHPSEANRIFGHNCGAPLSLYGCDMTGEQPCTYHRTNDNERNRVSCTISGVVTRVDLRPGRYSALGRACFFDANLNEVCRERDLPLVLEP